MCALCRPVFLESCYVCEHRFRPYESFYVVKRLMDRGGLENPTYGVKYGKCQACQWADRKDRMTTSGSEFRQKFKDALFHRGPGYTVEVPILNVRSYLLYGFNISPDVLDEVGEMDLQDHPGVSYLRLRGSREDELYLAAYCLRTDFGHPKLVGITRSKDQYAVWDRRLAAVVRDFGIQDCGPASWILAADV